MGPNVNNKTEETNDLTKKARGQKKKYQVVMKKNVQYLKSPLISSLLLLHPNLPYPVASSMVTRWKSRQNQW